MNKSEVIHFDSFADFAIKINSPYYPKELYVEGFFCGNPNCTCKDIALYFYEENEFLNNNPLFKLILNYETWSFTDIEVLNSNVDCLKIANGFIEELDDENKKGILLHKEKKVYITDDVLRNNINYSNFTLKNMPYFTQIYHSNDTHLFIFEFDKTKYLVTDRYCVNPKCKCLDTVLEFYVLNDNNFTKPSPLSIIRVSFKTKKWIIEEISKEGSTQLITQLYEFFMDNLKNNNANNLLEKRYNLMKKWGKEYLQPYLAKNTISYFSQSSFPTLKSTKISRNSPCTCGSGKKYKNCCGRKTN